MMTSSNDPVAMKDDHENDNSNNHTVHEDKKQLRKQIRSRLRSLSREEITKQSQQVWERLFSLQAYQQAKSVGLFLSMPMGEIDTDLVLQDAIQKGKTVYVPQVGKDFEKADMELIQVIIPTTTTIQDDTSSSSSPNAGRDVLQLPFHHSWPRNKWGIPEPPPSMPLLAAKPGDLDLIVVPGLAFDQSGNRLGQGKGYYDRFLARMKDNNNNNNNTLVKIPRLVAVGLDCQLVSDRSIPVHQYDHPMDMILLPSKVITPTR